MKSLLILLAVFLTACGGAATDETQLTGYVVKVKDSEMTVVADRPDGNVNHHYDAMIAKTPNDSIKVGQRVTVTFTGPMLMSYPGEGNAKSVAILSTRQFDHAHTPLDEVLKTAIDRVPNAQVPIIQHVSYSTEKKRWLVQIRFGRFDQRPVQSIFVDDVTGKIK